MSQKELGQKKRSILFATNTMGRAGAETTLITLLKQFDPERYDLYLFAVAARGEMFAALPPNVKVINTKWSEKSVLTGDARFQLALQSVRSLLRPQALARFIRTLPRNVKGQWRKRRTEAGFQLDKLLWELLADGAADKLLADRTFDLAIAFLEGGSTYWTMRYAKARKKLAFVHVDYIKAGLNWAQDAPFYADYDAIFCVSNDVRKAFLSAHPSLSEKTRVFHNRIPIEEIRERAKLPGGFDDTYSGLRLLTVARLHPQKALDIAIQAFRLVIDSGIDARWYIMGEGAEREKLERLIDANHLRGQFVLMGSRDNPYPYVAACDIYLQATHFEGWSIALAEALVLGRPIIASDCTGNREQIDDEVNGLLVPLEPDILAQAIIRLAKDKALREQFIQTLKGVAFQYSHEMEWLYTLAAGCDLNSEERELS